MAAARAAVRALQPDLLTWAPASPVLAYPAAAVQAGTVAGRIARAIAATLRDCRETRETVASRMSEYLGRRVSTHMVNGYASQGREEHVISAERLMALLHATGDRRLLQVLAEPFGLAVIEKRYLPLIDLARVKEREEELRREGDALRRQAQRSGLI